MSWQVIIRPKADLRDARSWYESQRTELGDQFLIEIGAAIRRLQIDPECRPPYYRDFRRLLTGRFPYKLFYRVETGRVAVFRILHAKQGHRQKL